MIATMAATGNPAAIIKTRSRTISPAVTSSSHFRRVRHSEELGDARVLSQRKSQPCFNNTDENRYKEQQVSDSPNALRNPKRSSQRRVRNGVKTEPFRELCHSK